MNQGTQHQGQANERCLAWAMQGRALAALQAFSHTADAADVARRNPKYARDQTGTDNRYQ